MRTPSRGSTLAVLAAFTLCAELTAGPAAARQGEDPGPAPEGAGTQEAGGQGKEGADPGRQEPGGGAEDAPAPATGGTAEAPAPAPSDGGATNDPPPGPPPEPPRFDQALRVAEIRAGLTALERAFPGRVRASTFATSTAGREVPLVVLGAPGRADLETPAMLVVAVGADPALHESELALAACWAVCGAADAAAVLERGTCYVLPLLDVDARETGAPPRGIRLDRNFPLGWVPASLRPGGGDLPLARPEATALVEFLLAHPNVVATVSVGGGRTSAADGRIVDGDAVGLRPGDRTALAQALDGPDAEGVAALDLALAPGGGILEYAYEAHGIYPLTVQPPGARTPDELAAWTARAGAAVGALLARLPRLALSVRRVERLGEGSWQLDLAVANEGRFASHSELGQARRPREPLWLELTGARRIAVAVQELPGEPFRAVSVEPGPDGAIPLPLRLSGAGTCQVRLVLEAASGTELALALRSSWTGRSALGLRLP